MPVRPAQSPGTGWLSRERPVEKEAGDEAACPAFGYLRGLREQARALEFRYRTGNSDWFPYSWLASWRHNPPVGLLLRFSGDVVTLVLIRGSNLDALVGQQTVNLTDRGLQRLRITYVREMDDDELRRAKQGEPTTDAIEVAEFESIRVIYAWLSERASAFLRRLR
jgi:hypothetical protein